jgi:hypothetical protein
VHSMISVPYAVDLAESDENTSDGSVTATNCDESPKRCEWRSKSVARGGRKT